MDWQVGDKAVCISATPNGFGDPHPCVIGRVYIVSHIVVSVTSGRLGLGFEGISFPNCLQNADVADNYRKVVSDEREACEPEFVTLLNRIKRKVSA